MFSSEDSGEGILHFNLGMINERSGQHPMAKTIFGSPWSSATTEFQKFDKKKIRLKISKKARGTPRFFSQFFGPKFFLRSVLFDGWI